MFSYFPFRRDVQVLARYNACPHYIVRMDYLEKAARVLDIEIFELKRLRERLGENFARAVELIKEVVDARGKVVVLGVGKSGHIGAKIRSEERRVGKECR